MSSAYFRVGDERYARKNKIYGKAILRRRHLRVEDDTMIFEYTVFRSENQQPIQLGFRAYVSMDRVAVTLVELLWRAAQSIQAPLCLGSQLNT
jgi:DNA topoisomerase IB